MQKHLKENGNIIYGDLTKQVNFKCDFKSKNNINNNTNNISGGGGQILSKPQYLSTLQSILYKPIAYFKFAKEVRELNKELALKRKG